MNKAAAIERWPIGYHAAFSNPCFEVWLLLHARICHSSGVMHSEYAVEMAVKSAEEIAVKAPEDPTVKILELITVHPAISVSEIAGKLGKSKIFEENHLSRLKKTGILGRTGTTKKGAWIILEDPVIAVKKWR